MPTMSMARARLGQYLRTARAGRIRVMKIIHGYGSSGKGGKIRTESRRYLTRLKEHGEIVNFLPGEKFSIFEDATRQAFARCDDLRRDADLDRYNNGVTFIVL